MTALDWRIAGPDLRIAAGRFAGWRYELERVHSRYAAPRWTARFFEYDGADVHPQTLADGVNFNQARSAVLAHHHAKY
jgi:hypothetical protein